MSGQSLTSVAIGEFPIVVGVNASADMPSLLMRGERGTLSVQLAPGAQFSHTVSDYVPCEARNCALLDVVCADYGKVPITATLSFPERGIVESWSGELTGYDPADPDSAAFAELERNNPVVNARRDAGSFQGALVVPAPNVPGEPVAITGNEVLLNLKFEPGQRVQGELLHWVEWQEKGGSKDDGVSGMQGPLIDFASPS